MKFHHARNSNYNTYIQTFRVVIIYTQYRTEYLQMRSAPGATSWASLGDWPNPRPSSEGRCGSFPPPAQAGCCGLAFM